MGSIFVRIIKMPCVVRGYTAPDANGDYNIYINEYLCDKERIRVYVHEIRHIKGNHFDKLVSAAMAEMEAGQ